MLGSFNVLGHRCVAHMHWETPFVLNIPCHFSEQREDLHAMAEAVLDRYNHRPLCVCHYPLDYRNVV